MNNNTTKTLAAVAALAIATLASGCAATMQQGPGSAPRRGDIALAVPVDAADGTVDVQITGTDMARPVFARLEVEDGVARGLVYDVAEGEGRRVLITATAADGRRCARQLDTNVSASTTNNIETAALQCEARHTLPPVAIASAERAFNDFPPVL